MADKLALVAKNMKRLSGRGGVRRIVSDEFAWRAKAARRFAKADAPRRSGGLARSIKSKVVRGKVISLWSNEPHARVVELGGRARNVVFRPLFMMRDGRDKAMKTFPDVVLRKIDGGLRNG